MTTHIEAQRTTKLFVNDPAWFLKDVLGCEVYPQQLAMMEAVRDERRVAVVGANGTGKDFAAARIMLWWLASRYPAKVIIIGPTYRQVGEVVWREVRNAYLSARVNLGGRIMESPRLWFDDNHFALGFSTDEPLNLQGFHSPNLLVLITEAHGVRQDIIDAIKRLNPLRLLLTGNALSTSGEFHAAFHGQAEQYKTMSISAYDTPNILAGKTVIPGMVTVEDIEERKLDWGEDSWLYQSSVLARFPETLEDTLIQRSWVDMCLELNFPVELDVNGKPKSPRPLVIACDVARFGSDRTVTMLREGAIATLLWKVSGQDTMATTGRLASYWNDHKSTENVIVDDTGVGGGVTDRLRELGIPVMPFIAGSEPVDKERFQNAQAEAWWHMAQAIKNKAIKLPNDRALIGQLVSRRYKIQSDRKIALQSKDELRKAGMNSPDEADALAMCFSPKCLTRPKIWT